MADEDLHHQEQDSTRSSEADSSKVFPQTSNAIGVQSFGTYNANYHDSLILIASKPGELHANDPFLSPEEQEVQMRAKQQAELEFLAKVKLHLNKALGEARHLKSRPTAMLVKMDIGMIDTADRSPVDANKMLGWDVQKINLEQVHDAMDDKSPRHVMLLGEAGAGKSTFSKMYSSAVSEGNADSLRDIKLVHFVNAATLQFQTPSSAFHLFFIDQLAQYHDTTLTSDQEKSGKEWLEKNSDKVLITIDGLDQCPDGFSAGKKYPRISGKSDAKAIDLIANIMSGRIWHRARILTSSRWNVFWKLNTDQKPDKVVALRGFDDENLKTAVFNLFTDGDGHTMLDQLRQTPPEFLAVCRNPMFLTYMTTIYQYDRDSLPNNISGLMSAVFRNFLRSYDIDDFENITKLAYNGMLDNLFAIPYSHVTKLGLKPDDLNNFCSPGAILEKGFDRVTSHDTFYVFSHQTMQEFCCALHVLNLKKNEIEEFVANSLNESRMTLTRQLLYGLIMNDEVTNPMRRYLEFGETSADDCRDILFAQLRRMIENGTLCDMKSIHLISECGDDIVRRMKNDVHSIIINDADLLQNDLMLLATMTKSLSPIRKVEVWQFILQPSVVRCVEDCLRSADSFKLETLSIVDKSMTEDGYEELANLLYVTNCNELKLMDWDLEKKKLKGLRQEFVKRNVKLLQLTIADKSMTEGGYKELAYLFHVTKCTTIRLGYCDLNGKKLDGLRQGFVKKNAKIENLAIIDKSMTEDGYGELANLLDVTKCFELALENCDLNKNKLAKLSEECLRGLVTMPRLRFFDKSMTADGYGQLASVLSVTKCYNLWLKNCDLNKSKLAELSEECLKLNVKLMSLEISDKLMTVDGYRALSHVINVTRCGVLSLIHCNLNKSKLSEIFKECEYGNIKKMYYLAIYENHSTASDAEVSALCDLMTNSLDSLGLYDWEIDARGIQRLKETFHREATQMRTLQLPNGEMLLKWPEMKPYVDRLQTSDWMQRIMEKSIAHVKIAEDEMLPPAND